MDSVKKYKIKRFFRTYWGLFVVAFIFMCCMLYLDTQIKDPDVQVKFYSKNLRPVMCDDCVAYAKRFSKQFVNNKLYKLVYLGDKSLTQEEIDNLPEVVTQNGPLQFAKYAKCQLFFELPPNPDDVHNVYMSNQEPIMVFGMTNRGLWTVIDWGDLTITNADGPKDIKY